MEDKRNTPHIAFLKENAQEIQADTTAEASEDSYLVPKSQTRTLYDGRYCAVSAFVFAVVDGKYSVLANQRGEGTPDYQECWNCPCGFLEANEDSKHGASREIFEETLEGVSPNWLEVVYVETEPEVKNVKWIPVDNINLFDWAFHHEETILELAPPKWKRTLIEWWFNVFYSDTEETHIYNYGCGTARKYGKFIEEND